MDWLWELGGDAVEVLLAIVAIGWTLIKFARSAAIKREKAARDAEQRAQTASTAPRPVAPPQKPSIWSQITEMIDEQINDADDEGTGWAGEGSFEGAVIARDYGEGSGFEGTQSPVWQGEGYSASDDAGCVGGSIQHDAHEGMPRSGSLDYTPATEYATIIRPAHLDEPAPAARVILTGQEARRAVVWAEILGKPAALRARHNLRGGIGS